MAKKKRSKSGQAGGSGAVVTEIRQVPGSRPQGFSVEAESKPSFYTSRYFEWLALAVASVASYWILTARLVGVNVSVLADEHIYVLDAHYKSLAEARFPNHLFQLLYSATKNCGPDFYSCARSLNAVFVIAGAIFVYLLAKHISGKKWLSSLITLGAVFGSYGTYTAYFMPEAMFNSGMLAFFWVILRFAQTESLLAWAGFGLVIGVASLAKPHAFFVLPAVVIFIVLLQRAKKQKYLLSAFLKVSAFLSAFFTSKLLFGFLISGERGASVLGNYASLPQAGELATEALVKNSGLNVIGTAWGQLLMITMVVGVALAVSVHGIIQGLLSRNSPLFESFSARTLIGLALLNMMAVTAIFEAWGNLDVWMHTRYYSYLIPLSAIVLLEAYSRIAAETKPIIKKVVVAIFTVIASVALVTAAIPYGTNWIDAPDFRFHIDNLVLSSVLIIASIALAIWWVWDAKTPMLIAIIVSLIASLFSGAHISNFLVTSFGKDSSFDQLGRVLKNYLPQAELDRAALIGENQTLLERALFGALTGEAQMIRAGEEPISVESLGPEISWVVKVGEANITGLPEPLITGSGYTIYSLATGNSFLPRNNDFESASEFCATPTNLGWICGDETIVSLSAQIPARGELDLMIDVSERVADTELELVLGDSILTGTFPRGIYSITLSFTNKSPASELIIRSKTPQEDTADEESRFVRIVSAIVNR